MAWTTPETAVAGEVLTAAYLNTNVVDNTADLRSYQNRYVSFRRTSGTVVLTGTTTWSTLTTIGTAADLTLTATAGDVVEGGINALAGNEVIDMAFDFVTVVGGVVTNSFGTNGAAPAVFANFSGGGWYMPAVGGAAGYGIATGSYPYTLQSGDVSGGQVTIRLRYAMGAATNRNLFCTAGNPFMIWARNHGPVTTA